MKIKSLSLVALLASFAAACGGSTAASSGGSTTPDAQGAIASTDIAAGEAVWAAKCAGCHTEADGAYGPRVGDLAWAPDRMRAQIREGEGRMPAFDHDSISSADLESLLAYMQTINGVRAE